jgi:hypothetical protein
VAGALRTGICRVCGCTENRACIFDAGPGSSEEASACWWVNAAKTLCSNPQCLAVVPLEQIENELEAEMAGNDR